MWQFSLFSKGWTPKVSKGRSESPLVASAEAKPPAKQKKESKTLSLACHKKPVSCGNFRSSAREGPRRGPGGDRKAPWSPPQRRNPLRNRKKKVSSFPLPSARNLFLVRGFVRLRADEVLSHTGKYPKGAGGGQRVHVSWPPPDPPLLSYNAPLASQGRAQLGSRPSLGGPLSPSAQLIPPPAPRRRSILGVIGKGPSRQCHLAAVRAPASGPCKVCTRPGTRLVAGPRPNQMACPIRTLSVEKQGEVPLSVQGGSGGIPRPFEGGIGGPGGHRGEVGIPPAPLAGGATLQKENHFTKSSKHFSFAGKASFPEKSLSPKIKKQFLCHWSHAPP